MSEGWIDVQDWCCRNLVFNDVLEPRRFLAPYLVDGANLEEDVATLTCRLQSISWSSSVPMFFRGQQAGFTGSGASGEIRSIKGQMMRLSLERHQGRKGSTWTSAFAA